MVSASAPLLPLAPTLGKSRPSSAGSDASGASAAPSFRESTARASMPSPRPGTAAADSVRAFLTDPEALSRMDVGDEVSTDGSSVDDGDIPEVLLVAPQHAAQRSASVAGFQGGGGRAAVHGRSRPQTCRGALNRLDGPLSSSGGAGLYDGARAVRPQTAHAGTALSGREKLERRKAYKAPKPPTDGIPTFARAAQARFRT